MQNPTVESYKQGPEVGPVVGNPHEARVRWLPNVYKNTKIPLTLILVLRSPPCVAKPKVAGYKTRYVIQVNIFHQA